MHTPPTAHTKPHSADMVITSKTPNAGLTTVVPTINAYVPPYTGVIIDDIIIMASKIVAVYYLFIFFFVVLFIL